MSCLPLTWHMFSATCLCEFKMGMSIPNSTNCEVHSVIRFLNVKEAPAKLCQIVSVYGDMTNKLLLFMVIF